MTYKIFIERNDEIIVEREISADQAIDFILQARDLANMQTEAIAPEVAEPEPEPIPATKKTKKGKRGRLTGRKCVCKNCGQPGHIAKTCAVARGIQPQPRAKNEPTGDNLSEDQFNDIKYLVSIGDMNSKEFAEDNDLPVAEVNRAIQSKDYRDYCDA